MHPYSLESFTLQAREEFLSNLPAMPGAQEIREAIESQLQQRLDAIPGPKESWTTAGLDSLEVIDVLLKLEAEFEREIPVGEFADEPTTDGLVEFLSLHLGEGS